MDRGAAGSLLGSLIGRVNSTFQLLSFGMLPLGAALGGVLGRTLGLRSPFLIGGGVLLVMAVVAIPIITTQAIEAARAAVQSSTSPP